MKTLDEINLLNTLDECGPVTAQTGRFRDVQRQVAGLGILSSKRCTKRAMSLAIAIWGVLSFLPLLADIASPQPHYKAMPHAEWMTRKFNVVLEDLGEIAFYIVLVACVVLMVRSIVEGIKSRRYKRMFVWLLMVASAGFVLAILRAVLLVWLVGPMFQAVAPIHDYDVIVSPKSLESYEEYLLRVDRLEMHICIKCGTQKQTRFRGAWHCPKCEPEFFVCGRCGCAKEQAFHRDRGIYLCCPKCEKVVSDKKFND